MPHIDTTLRDGDALCRSVGLPGGETLTRDDRDPLVWRSQLTGRTGSLLALVCAQVDADDFAHARCGRDPDEIVNSALTGLRAAQGRRFLRQVSPGNNGFVIHDELEDPVRGEHEIIATAGDQVWGAHDIHQPEIRIWTGLGPSATDIRRSYAAAALLAYALNRRLGVAHGRVAAQWVRVLPLRPWRILETQDTLFLMDAADQEIMSLRSRGRRLDHEASSRELATVRDALSAANDLGPNAF
jgi:hypothetical protein